MTHPTEYEKKLIASNGEIEVSHCFKCGFAHIQPNLMLQDQYYSDDIFYTDYSPASDWFEKERKEYDSWKPYFKYLSLFLEADKPIIDIGCGAGWFLKFLDHHGQNVIGVEPSELAHKHSHVSSLMVRDLSEVQVKGNIVLSLTLEHISNPLSFLKECIKYLDGNLIVVVPNEFNPLQWDALKERDSAWFINRVHCNYFTPSTLRLLLLKAGLKVKSEGSTFPMELFLQSPTSDYRDNEENGRMAHEFRLDLEKKFGVRAFILYAMLYREFGIGREVVMVASK